MAPAAPQSPQQQQSPQQHQPPQQHQSPQHGLPLSSLDGVATFVMGTTGIPKQPWLNWWTRVVPTFNTWGRENRHLYVVLPHVSATLQFLRKRRCVAGPLPPRALAHKFRLKEPLEYTCPRPWTSSTAETETAILPTILVTAYSQLNCTDEYRGDGPCCKANFALWFMLTVKRHMLATPLAKGRNNDNSGNGAVAADGAGGGGIKWVAFLDDDVYVRGAGLAALLGNGLDPVYSAVAVVPAEKCFRPPYHKDDPKKRATDNFPHACRPYFNDTFWAHPAWLSVASLYKAELGILAGGVRDQCGVLGTSHEAGLGQFLWMHGVGCTPLSPNAYSARGDLKPGLVVVHRSRVKAGDLNSSLPLEDTPPALLKMHQVHDYFTLGPGKGDVWGRLGGEHNSSGSSSSSSSLVGGSHSVPPEVLRQLPPPPPLVPPPPLIGPTKWPNGYSRTPHASGHNLQRKWEKLTNAGCVASPAGVTTPPLALGSAKNRPE